MRGENPPRAHGGWSRAQVWCPFCSRCSPAIGRPGYFRGGGSDRSPPLLAAAPRLCAREWMEERTSAQRCSNYDWLTDWRCCAPWNRHSDWARRHPPAGSQSLIPIPIHDHTNEALELETRAFGSGGRVPIHALEWGMPFRQLFTSAPALSQTSPLRSLEQPDFHRSSPLSCQTAAPWLLSSGHWYYRSRAILSISVWLTYLLQGKTCVKMSLRRTVKTEKKV